MDQDLKNQNRLKFLNYNKKRHRELLAYSQSLKEQGKSLNHENYLELLNCSAILNAQLDWEAGEYYLELFDQLMKEKLDTDEFFAKFSQQSEVNGEVVDILESKLILLSPHEKSLNFSDFVEEIVDYWESFSNDPNNDPDSLTENYDFFDKQLRDFIEKIYLEIQELLEDSKNK